MNTLRQSFFKLFTKQKVQTCNIGMHLFYIDFQMHSRTAFLGLTTEAKSGQLPIHKTMVIGNTVTCMEAFQQCLTQPVGTFVLLTLNMHKYSTQLLDYRKSLKVKTT